MSFHYNFLAPDEREASVLPARGDDGRFIPALPTLEEDNGVDSLREQGVDIWGAEDALLNLLFGDVETDTDSDSNPETDSDPDPVYDWDEVDDLSEVVLKYREVLEEGFDKRSVQERLALLDEKYMNGDRARRGAERY